MIKIHVNDLGPCAEALWTYCAIGKAQYIICGMWAMYDFYSSEDELEFRIKYGALGTVTK